MTKKQKQELEKLENELESVKNKIYKDMDTNFKKYFPEFVEMYETGFISSALVGYMNPERPEDTVFKIYLKNFNGNISFYQKKEDNPGVHLNVKIDTKKLNDTNLHTIIKILCKISEFDFKKLTHSSKFEEMKTILNEINKLGNPKCIYY